LLRRLLPHPEVAIAYLRALGSPSTSLAAVGFVFRFGLGRIVVFTVALIVVFGVVRVVAFGVVVVLVRCLFVACCLFVVVPIRVHG
jgi:hypothetical protein